MLEGIYERLARQHSRPTILCGDFNTPQVELRDGTAITWAWKITKTGKRVLVRERGQLWDDAEQNVLTGLARFDLADAFRRIHGYSVEDFSWKTRNGIRRRFDHVFASAQLNPVQCDYLHALRAHGLSDHSPIQVTFDPQDGDADVNLAGPNPGRHCRSDTDGGCSLPQRARFASGMASPPGRTIFDGFHHTRIVSGWRG